MLVRRLTLAAAAVAAGSLALPAAGHAATCPLPGKISTRAHSQGVKVSWKPSASLRRADASYRVFRGRTVVGQTTASSMLVRATPGRRVTVRVGVVGPGGRAPKCFASRTVRVTAAVRLAAPSDFVVQPIDSSSVQLGWRRVKGAKGYRVARDGKTVGQPRTPTLQTAVQPGRTHSFSVTAVGPGDRLGKESPALRFESGSRGPAAPGAVSASIVTTNSARLAWTPAEAGTAPVRAYRVSRDGLVVGQYNALQADVTSLVHSRDYRLSVAAVDTRGVVGPERGIHVRTSLPAPSTGKLHAFVLASTDESFRALQQRYTDVGVVYPTYFDCVPSDVAQVKGVDDPLITQWTKDRNLQILPRFNCQRPQTLKAIFADAPKRAELIDRLTAIAVEHDYDGINLDFEAGAPEDRDALTAFVADLATALHGAGRQLSIDVSAKVRDVANHPRSTFFDYGMISRYADHVVVMSWGLHWRTSAPGPIAPADWLLKVYDYVATQPNKHKFVMALPLYGFDWPAGGGPANPGAALSFAEIQTLIARYGAQVRADALSGELTFTYSDEQGVGHEVWYGDGASTAERFRIAGDRGLGGIGVWRLGQEDPAFWTHPVIAG